MPTTQELAEERTDYAEDRTILANERTFAGWMRTGVASAALGLGVQAIFRAVEPTWMAKTCATAFLLIAVAVFYLAYRKSCHLAQRMDAHSTQPLSHIEFGVIASLFSAGTALLGALLWVI
ncbi:MAG: DUF202 domain-containing protein [Pseudomonadota bacterium]|jgi:putative membrane protein|nr:DUF202 domain-containing protein [Pseudomonadota bacterium]